MLVHFMAILAFLRPFDLGIFCVHLVFFPVLVCCTKKNLATLSCRCARVTLKDENKTHDLLTTEIWNTLETKSWPPQAVLQF
jgi:hypothetical protein